MRADDERHFHVLIIGGGNAGISAAARLIRKGVRRVAIIEPQQVHTYRPLLSYVGGGESALSSAERSQRSVIPDSCTWIRDSAVAVEPPHRTVQSAANGPYRYDDLVIGTELEPRHRRAPWHRCRVSHTGCRQQLPQPRGEDVGSHRSHTGTGRAVFTVPRPPVSCTGTTVKPLFLAAGYWWRQAARHLDITLVVDRPKLLEVPALDTSFRRCCASERSRIYSTPLIALKPEADSIAVTTRSTEHLPYDMLHLCRRSAAAVAAVLFFTAQVPTAVDIDSKPCTPHLPEHLAWDVAAVDTDPSARAAQTDQDPVDNLLPRSGVKYRIHATPSRHRTTHTSSSREFISALSRRRCRRSSFHQTQPLAWPSSMCYRNLLTNTQPFITPLQLRVLLDVLVGVLVALVDTRDGCAFGIEAQPLQSQLMP